MRVCLVVLFALCGFASAADLVKEDLRSVQAAFLKTNASLDSFEVVSKKSFYPARSVIIVRAAPRAMQRVGPNGEERLLPVFEKSEIGVFVVSGSSNRVETLLDIFPENSVDGFPGIEATGEQSVSLHFTSDYGIDEGSVKYFYDSAGVHPVHKVRYKMLALTSSTVRNGKLVYTGEGSQITIEPHDGAAPSYRIVPVATSASGSQPQPVSYRLSDGTPVQAVGTPAGSSHQPAGFSVSGQFYPVPVPSTEFERKMRPAEQAPLEIENDIGPSLLAGGTIWFTNSFYDGEGTSGVGALGSFDVHTHQYQMRYLPEIVNWSGSAIRLDGDFIWIGLMRQPEGSAYGGGLLRYDTKTGAVKHYAVTDYVHTIDRVGDAIYCGTSNGIYVIRGETITQLRFEPDASGKTTMISSRR